MTRVALYARVSTPEQDPMIQIEELRSVAQHRSWDIVTEAIEIGSGGRSDLPERAKLLDLAYRGRIDVIAIWRLDRLGRSVRDLVNTSFLLRESHVELFSLRDQIDTSTSTGRVIFTVLASIAELERDLIRERSIAGQQKAKRQGKHVGRKWSRFSLSRAIELLDQGTTLTRTAKELGTTRWALRRRLLRAGVEFGGGVRNPSSEEGVKIRSLLPSEGG